MSNLAGLPSLGLKEPKAKPDPAYLARVRELPCCVCEAFGEPQATPHRWWARSRRRFPSSSVMRAT